MTQEECDQLNHDRDNEALQCGCGSVKFCLLGTGEIECSRCLSRINKHWVTHTVLNGRGAA